MHPPKPLLPLTALAVFGTLAAISPGAAWELGVRLAPVLTFAAGMTVVVNLAAEVRLFEWVVDKLAGLPLPRAAVIFFFIVLCALSTTFFSLDTTAVMLTPLAVALASEVGVPVSVLALAVVWMANLGSLALPVSNLTNLLAVDAGSFASQHDYVSRALPSALVAMACAAVAFGALRIGRVGTHRPESTPPAPPQTTPPRPTAALAIIGLTLPALVSPIPYWATSTFAAVAMAIAVRPSGNRAGAVREIPWHALLITAALSAAANVLLQLGAAGRVSDSLGHAGPLALAAAGMGAANLINNIPAYFILEPAAVDPSGALALLVGVNAGAVITPWASLATLLWADQLRRAGQTVPWSRFMGAGLVLAPAAVAAAVGTLQLTAAA